MSVPFAPTSMTLAVPMPLSAAPAFAASTAFAALLSGGDDLRLDELRIDAGLEHRDGSLGRTGKERQRRYGAGAKPQ